MVRKFKRYMHSLEGVIDSDLKLIGDEIARFEPSYTDWWAQEETREPHNVFI